MGKIFISYRRDDSQDMAGRIYDWLVANFGEKAVFKDVDSLPAGEQFPERISSFIAECDVLLALIGEHWLDARDTSGRRRLHDDKDYVRLEISEALRREVTAVPVLLHQTAAPAQNDLPTDCSELLGVGVPELRVRSDPEFDDDIDRLLDWVESATKARRVKRWSPRNELEEQQRPEREAKEQAQAQRERDQAKAELEQREQEYWPARRIWALLVFICKALIFIWISILVVGFCALFLFSRD